MVKDILGHSDIHTTMRYAHAITEQSLDTVEALSNYAEKNKKVIELKEKENNYYFLITQMIKNSGLAKMLKPLLVMVAGAGFEPTTFGL